MKKYNKYLMRLYSVGELSIDLWNQSRSNTGDIILEKYIYHKFHFCMCACGVAQWNLIRL